MTEIKVLLADDHTLIRDGIRKILSLEPGFRVVGEAGSGYEVVRLAGELSPDVILMDINMPGMNGIEASQQIKKAYPEIEIIALTIHGDEEYVYELVKAGISGYLLKDISADELVSTIRRVFSGESVFNPAIARKLLGEFRRLTGGDVELRRLSRRELEVLEHVVRGENNKEIAEKLFISEKTVKNHLTNIFRKINVKDRTQAVLYSVKNKLVKL